MKKIEKDSMPIEVATAMLTEPKARLTNRMRKMCMAAREVCYVSEVGRKPVEAKLKARMHNRGIVWLTREVKRISHKRQGLQIKYDVAKRLQETAPTPILDRALALLDLRAAHLDLVLDAVETEIETRRK